MSQMIIYGWYVRVSIVQCVAVCCSQLQYVTKRYDVYRWVWCVYMAGMYVYLYCSMLQWVAVCCSTLHYGAVRCSAVQCGAVSCSAVQCSAVQCSAIQCNAVCCSASQCVAVRCSALQCVAVRCSALQCVAVRCSALQCDAVRCSALQCDAVRCSPWSLLMGWLRLVGSLKLLISLAEYRLFNRALLQKRPIIWRSVLIVATPYFAVDGSLIHGSRSQHWWVSFVSFTILMGLFCLGLNIAGSLRSVNVKTRPTKETCNIWYKTNTRDPPILLGPFCLVHNIDGSLLPRSQYC